MFRGRFETTIDVKGRTSIPAKFREVLSSNYDDRLIVTNFDNCLWAYPVKEWQVIEEKVSALPQFKPEVKALQRVFVSAAQECAVDKQGRILIPPSLRDYAALEKDIVLLGMIKRVEIWAKDRWTQEFARSQNQIEESMESLANLGI